MRVSATDLRETAAPPPGVLIVGRHDGQPDYAVRRTAGAPSWLLLWTESGAGHVRQGGVETTAGPGSLVLLAPGVHHTYRTAPDAAHWGLWWAHFLLRPGWEQRLRPYDLGSGCHVMPDLHPGARTGVAAALRQAHADSRWTGTGAPPRPVSATRRAAPASVATGPDAVALALGSVERALLLATSPSGGTGPGDARVRRAQALIDADPAAAHTVDSLAAAVALSPSRFAHLFAKETGSTPMRALREARLRHAACLLTSTELTVAQVAAASGFAGPFHFSHAFRGRYGTPPKAYRSAAG
ncbi:MULTISPECIES: helix-turn-helix domain-containing protein [unclassified Streptomyces]|jgi:AraC family transcriptional regulator of arabinose operon|uniref:Helix-turn-helix domain-containing protein n=1 Tax=Streptomyces sp. NBC_00119 TaxID=2975659 RepID=A0AAU1U1G8_9ACTN|nr:MULTISPECIES: helix-turn-helix domain-containing protein [unclassified Streptomyces]MCX4648893.1 helix-turn-helix domain-containing protein [Streptomyces sp. NBC_01446]MCX5322986.1 helix-turn-helix domain-containing protein [Streptomyces sp. NBC_00120]